MNIEEEKKELCNRINEKFSCSSKCKKCALSNLKNWNKQKNKWLEK